MNKKVARPSRPVNFLTMSCRPGRPGYLLFLALWILIPLTATQKDPLSNLGAYCERALTDLDCRGVSIAVVKDDRVVFVDGFGTQGQNGGKVDMHTLFAIGSLTKAMTSALIAELVAEKQLEFQTNVLNYLPGFLMYDPEVTQMMLLEDLLCHRSGMRDHAGDLLFLAEPPATIISRLRYLAPVTSFRSAFAYQNTLYVVAGQIVSQAGGTPWQQQLKERILEPLGMKETVTDIRKMGEHANTSYGQLPVYGKWLEVPWDQQVNFDAAGSVGSNAWEMAQWVRFLLKPDELPKSFYSLKLVAEPRIFLPREDWVKFLYRVNHFLSYGFGWFAYDYYNYQVIEHSGNVPGSTAKLLLVPELNLGVIVLCNQHESLLPHAIVMRVLDLYTEQSSSTQVDWISRMKTASDPFAGQSTHVDRTVSKVPNLEQYLGAYSHNVLGTIILDNQEGLLRVTWMSKITGYLSPIEANNFIVRWDQIIPRLIPGELPAHFENDGPGQTSALVIEGLARFRRRS